MCKYNIQCNARKSKAYFAYHAHRAATVMFIGLLSQVIFFLLDTR